MKNSMYLVLYEINHLPFDTLILADSLGKAWEEATQGVRDEAGKRPWRIVSIEEVPVDLEHYMDY